MDSVARAAVQVDNQFYRVLTVLRAVTLLFAVGLNAARWRDFTHPTVAWFLIGVMIVWSGVMTWAYDDPDRRRAWLYALDIAVTVALLRATVYVEPFSMRAEHAPTLTSYWVVTPVLCCAVRWGAWGGLIATVVVQTADVTLRPHITSSTIGNIFLMAAAGLLIGYVARVLRESARTRTMAERVAAEAAERERLARVVHDGVLQVLALVQRRGAELGGAAADLGKVAAEQEAALRALVQQSAVSRATPADGSDDRTDLAAELNALSSPSVSVATPGTAVLMPRGVVEEVASIVRACLDNVTRHVGEGASAWVLLDDDADTLRVSVRDDGPGIPDGRLAEAEADGRMGVSKSIKGRIVDLGGSADLVTGPGLGTEWEFTLTRDRRR